MTKTAAAFLIISIVFFSGCVSQDANQDRTIKIGAMLVLSGEGSSWGEASHRAIDMAVREANENGGINGGKIEVVYEDTQGSASKAVSAYNKLSRVDNVVAIIGPNMQTEMSAIAPLAFSDGVPVIAPSYSPLSNRPDPRNPMMIWITPVVESGRMAEYVYGEGVRKMAVIGTEDSWEKDVSEAFADRFRSLGGEIVFIELLQPSAEDARTAATKAMDKSPEAIYLGTYYQFLNLGRALKELGYKGKMYSIEVDEYLASESSGFTTGMQFISPELYKDSFRQEYEETYKAKSSIPAGQAYDATNILISFLEKNSTRNSVLGQMKDFRSYDGVSGIIEIDDNNATLISTAIYELHDGEITRLMPV